MPNCTIRLENYTGVYYNGSEIKGKLECNIDEKITVRGIKIRLLCVETNKFTNFETYTHPDRGGRETKHKFLRKKGYYSEIYNIEQKLWESGGKSQVLDQGRYEYPFSFTLPLNCPSSINHSWGCIYYRVKGIIDIPMGFDFEDRIVLRVDSLVDFNKMPKELQEAASYSKEKKIGYWCCRNGNITLDVKLPKKAFVPGEVVDLKATISNMSNSNVERITAKLTRTVQLALLEKDNETVSSLGDQGGVGAHNERTFDLQLAIPESFVVPNFCGQTYLFKVRFLLVVCCEISGSFLDLKLNIEDVVLGHIKWGYEEIGQRNRTNEDSSGSANNYATCPPYQSIYPVASAPVEYNS